MFTIEKINSFINGVIHGDKHKVIKKISEFKYADEYSVVFIKNKSDMKYINESKAGLIIGPKGILNINRDNNYIILNELNMNSYNSFLREYLKNKEMYFVRNRTTDRIKEHRQNGVIVGENVIIGSNCLIHPGVVIMNFAIIGNNVEIFPNTVIQSFVSIGDNVFIDSNCSIGGQSFEYYWNGSSYIRHINVGDLVINKGVEIGTNVCIDRGTLGSTIIGEYTKIDNIVQIGHDTIIGHNCLIISQTGIAGWVKIGNNVIVHGQVGIKGGVEIGDNVTIQAKSGVTKNISSNINISGFPAKNNLSNLRDQAIVDHLIKAYKNK